MARRAMSRNKDLVTSLLWGALGIGLGTALYYSIKTLKKPQGLSTGSVGGGGSTPSSGTPGGTSSSPVSVPIVSALITRLNGSAGARSIFLFQAGMYSFAQIPDLPDGLFGDKTSKMIQIVNQASGNASASTSWSNAALQRLAAGLKSFNAVGDLSQVHAKVLPPLLPANLIQQINAEGVDIAADVPLLQMFPS